MMERNEAVIERFARAMCRGDGHDLPDLSVAVGPTFKGLSLGYSIVCTDGVIPLWKTYVGLARSVYDDIMSERERQKTGISAVLDSIAGVTEDVDRSEFHRGWNSACRMITNCIKNKCK